MFKLYGEKFHRMITVKYRWQCTTKALLWCGGSGRRFWRGARGYLWRWLILPCLKVSLPGVAVGFSAMANSPFAARPGAMPLAGALRFRLLTHHAGFEGKYMVEFYAAAGFMLWVARTFSAGSYRWTPGQKVIASSPSAGDGRQKVARHNVDAGAVALLPLPSPW